MSKAFESIFGGVTCLPGCFCMYRIIAPKNGQYVPIICSTDIVESYCENVVDTLHKKNLLLLGEDRYLTTLMLRTFPKRKMVFVPQAVSLLLHHHPPWFTNMYVCRYAKQWSPIRLACCFHNDDDGSILRYTILWNWCSFVIYVVPFAFRCNLWCSWNLLVPWYSQLPFHSRFTWSSSPSLSRLYPLSHCCCWLLFSAYPLFWFLWRHAKWSTWDGCAFTFSLYRYGISCYRHMLTGTLMIFHGEKHDVWKVLSRANKKTMDDEKGSLTAKRSSCVSLMNGPCMIGEPWKNKQIVVRMLGIILRFIMAIKEILAMLE